MNLRNQHNLIESTLSLMKDKETKTDWLTKQILQLDQTPVSFKQKKKRLILLANHLAKIDPLAMVIIEREKRLKMSDWKEQRATDMTIPLLYDQRLINVVAFARNELNLEVDSLQLGGISPLRGIGKTTVRLT